MGSQITSKKCNNCNKNSPTIKMLGTSKFQIQEIPILESIITKINYLEMDKQLKWIKNEARTTTLVKQRLGINKNDFEVYGLKRKKLVVNRNTNLISSYYRNLNINETIKVLNLLWSNNWEQLNLSYQGIGSRSKKNFYI